MLLGEPGVGKTRLAQEATLVLRETGFLIAGGRCYESRQSTAYHPFLEALENLYRMCSFRTRDDVGSQWPYLAHLLPEHGLPLPPKAEAADERDRLLRAVAGFITTAAANCPIAIVIDDLHWADEASLDLVQHLARNTRSSRVLILATCRDADVRRSPRLSKALRDLYREQLVDQLPVRRLRPEASAELIRLTMHNSDVFAELADLIYASAAGNPFFTVEILRAVAERGDLLGHNERWEYRDNQIVIPGSVRDAIGERIGRLSSEAQTLLDEASVLGQTFAFDHILNVFDRTESDTEELIQEAVADGVCWRWRMKITRLIMRLRSRRYTRGCPRVAAAAFIWPPQRQSLMANMPMAERPIWPITSPRLGIDHGHSSTASRLEITPRICSRTGRPKSITV